MSVVGTHWGGSFPSPSPQPGWRRRTWIANTALAKAFHGKGCSGGEERKFGVTAFTTPVWGLCPSAWCFSQPFPARECGACIPHRLPSPSPLSPRDNLGGVSPPKLQPPSRHPLACAALMDPPFPSSPTPGAVRHRCGSRSGGITESHPGHGLLRGSAM